MDSKLICSYSDKADEIKISLDYHSTAASRDGNNIFIASLGRFIIEWKKGFMGGHWGMQ